MKPMKKTGKKALFVLLFFSLHVFLAADGIISVNAEVDAARIGMMDTLTLTLTVNAENTARIPDPVLPELKHFNVLNESTKSQTSISIINGKTTRTKSTSHIFTLEPKSKGTFTIDPISIEYRGQLFRTEPITVTVVEGYVKSDRGMDSQREEFQVDLEKLKEDIFILVKPENSKIFEGEQLLLTYTLYSRLDIDSISLKESPEFPGFYKEEIFNATRLEERKETYEDKTYNTTLLKKVVLFPINPGTFTPRPLVLEMTVYLRGEDLFSFFGRPYTFLVNSNDLEILVEPLPVNSTGKRFSHVVGNLEATISKRENTANTGESTTCYLTLKSTGNLNMISDTGIQLSKRGRVYLSETIMDRVEEDEKVYFVKKFEYTIIAEESGTLDVHTQELLYFDTAQKVYASVTPQPVEIKIIGKDIFQEKPIIGQKKGHSEGGFHFIKGNVKELKSSSLPFFRGPYYYFYHIILAAVTGALFFVKLKRETLEKNQNLFKMKKARSFAHDWLKKAQAAISSEFYTESVDHIYRALATYVAFKCGKNPQEITYKTIPSLLTSCLPVSEGTKDSIQEILEQCTLLKYAKGNKNEVEQIKILERIKILYEKTVAVIDSVESSRIQTRNQNEEKKGGGLIP